MVKINVFVNDQWCNCDAFHKMWFRYYTGTRLSTNTPPSNCKNKDLKEEQHIEKTLFCSFINLWMLSDNLGIQFNRITFGISCGILLENISGFWRIFFGEFPTYVIRVVWFTTCRPNTLSNKIIDRNIETFLLKSCTVIKIVDFFIIFLVKPRYYKFVKLETKIL